MRRTPAVLVLALAVTLGTAVSAPAGRHHWDPPKGGSTFVGKYTVTLESVELEPQRGTVPPRNHRLWLHTTVWANTHTKMDLRIGPKDYIPQKSGREDFVFDTPIYTHTDCTPAEPVQPRIKA